MEPNAVTLLEAPKFLMKDHQAKIEIILQVETTGNSNIIHTKRGRKNFIKADDTYLKMNVVLEYNFNCKQNV